MSEAYEQIGGWFDWHETYRRWARELPDGGVIVEVGCFLGRSTRFLADELASLGKRAKIIAVDTWEGSPEMQHMPVVAEGRIYEQFCANLAPYLTRQGQDDPPVAVYVKRGDSSTIGRELGVGVQYVWLDGDHSLAGVTADLEAWWPHVVPGGEMGGHDLGFFEVTQAVETWVSRAGLVFEVLKPTPGANVAHSWLVRKPGPVTSWTVPEGQRSVLFAVASNFPFCWTPTTVSLWEMGVTMREQAAAHGFSKVHTFWAQTSPGVDDLRDECVFEALRLGASHLVFLDADQVWPSQTVSMLLAHHDRGIVAGQYHLRGRLHEPVALLKSQDDPDPNMYTYDYYAHEEHDLRPVDVVGMGCTLIPMALFSLLPRPWFAYQRNAHGFARITEDLHFCQQAARVGCPILLEPRIKCGHVTTKVVTEQDYVRNLTHIEAALREKRRQQRARTAVDDARAAQAAALRGGQGAA